MKPKYGFFALVIVGVVTLLILFNYYIVSINGLFYSR